MEIDFPLTVFMYKTCEKHQSFHMLLVLTVSLLKVHHHCDIP